MSDLKIIGAGMAGLLAANMLYRHKPVVVERQSELPNNHHGLLRFRTPSVGEACGVQFRKVRMIKTVVSMPTDAAAALGYSAKVTGTYRSDRSLPNGTVYDDRYIAPDDFIRRMAETADIEYGRQLGLFDIGRNTISTIPMPALMDMLGYQGERPEFKYRNSVVYRATLPLCDAFVTVYDPRPEWPMARISLTGSELIIERPLTDIGSAPFQKRAIVDESLRLLGIELSSPLEDDEIEVKNQKYSKIIPCDDILRRRFIHWATDRHGVYSLGRFATWRPGVLLDDLVKDIRIIERWLNSAELYEISAYR